MSGNTLLPIHDSPSVASYKVHLKKAEQNRKSPGLASVRIHDLPSSDVFQGESVAAGPAWPFFFYLHRKTEVSQKRSTFTTHQ